MKTENKESRPKKRRRISIVDFDSREGCFTECLLGMVAHKYDVEIAEDDPDFMLHSCFGQRTIGFYGIQKMVEWVSFGR